MDGIASLLIKVRNNGLAAIQFLCVTLWHMSISAGVVRAVALQQIHHTPHAKACVEGHNKGLQSADGRRKELHIASISPGNTRLARGHSLSDLRRHTRNELGAAGA